MQGFVIDRFAPDRAGDVVCSEAGQHRPRSITRPEFHPVQPGTPSPGARTPRVLAQDSKPCHAKVVILRPDDNQIRQGIGNSASGNALRMAGDIVAL